MDGRADSSGGEHAAAAMLEWMEAHQPRLWELLLAETPDPEAPLDAAFDGAMRAHLLLVAEALAARLGGEIGDRLATRLDEIATGLLDEEALEEERGRVLDAILHEARLQFGERAPQDPQDPRLREWAERRASTMAWPRRLLVLVDEQIAVFDLALAPQALAWIAQNQRRLGRLGLRTLESQMTHSRAGRRAAGEAASLQAHVRFLVEALGAALGDPDPV